MVVGTEVMCGLNIKGVLPPEPPGCSHCRLPSLPESSTEPPTRLALWAVSALWQQADHMGLLPPRMGQL